MNRRPTTAHEVSIPSWVDTVPAPTDYEPRYAVKRAMLRSGSGLRRGPRFDVIGPAEVTTDSRGVVVPIGGRP